MKNMRVLFLLLPALVIMFLIAVVPLITVFNYSLLDLFAGTFAEPVGWQNYVSTLRDPAFMSSIKKQFLFTFIVILIEIPLGIGLAFTLPKQKTSWSVIDLILLGTLVLFELFPHEYGPALLSRERDCRQKRPHVQMPSVEQRREVFQPA